MNDTFIPHDKVCDSGCGQQAQFFSKSTGRYRCAKSANSCPANKAKNSKGLKTAHAEGRGYTFTSDDRDNSHASRRRKLVEDTPIEELGPTLRKRIVLEEQDYKCDHCDLAEWMGLRITLELDHIDGNNKNNVRENLRCLCPNCHSLTDTWKIGQHVGKKVRKRTDNEIIEAFHNTGGNINAMLNELEYNWGSVSTVKKVLFRYKLIDKI